MPFNKVIAWLRHRIDNFRLGWQHQQSLLKATEQIVAILIQFAMFSSLSPQISGIRR